jgi:mercuric transport protein
MTRSALLRAAGRALVLLTVSSVLAAGLPGAAAPGHAAEAKTVELAVEGMTCAACTFAVKAALKKLDGVDNAKVSFREKKAVVTYDPDRVTPEDMVSAVDKTGFSASLPEPTEK